MGTLWPKSGLIARDNSDLLAVGALAYFTDAGTSTPKAVYQDAAETTPHTNPVVTDGNGRWPGVFIPFGSYKERITTSAGAAIGPTIDNIPNVAPFDSSIVTDPLLLYATGHVSVGLGNETRSGFVRLNGRSIGNAASSATERANADTSALFVHIWDRLVDAQAPVSGGRGGSGAADYAANKRITLPDYRGAGLRGFDDMGNTAASLLGSAPVVLGSTILPGSILGGNTQTLTTANLASHSHTGTVGTESAHTHTFSVTSGTGTAHTHTVNITDPGHSHQTNAVLWGNTNGVNNDITKPAAGNSGTNYTHASAVTGITAAAVNESAHTHAVSGTVAATSHTHTFTGDASGSGTAHNNVARDGLVTFYIHL